jgi:DNA polymerase-1
MAARVPFDPEQTLYLLDISSFIFRAFFAIRSLSNRRGEPTNAIYGVATMLSRLIDDAHPKHLAVAYDSKGPSFREEIYPEYKANRSAPPDDLIPQFARIDEMVGKFGMHSFRHPGVEADDLIASLTRLWLKASPKHQVVVVTGDKDLMQLVDKDGRVCVWDTMKNEIYHAAEVEAKFGVRPDQLRDYLALVGDSSDNIPGVPSIGPKSAVDLLKEHGDLEAILKAAKAGKIAGKKGETIRNHEKEAHLSAELATMKGDLKLDFEVKDFGYEFKVGEECLEFLRDMDLHTLVKKWSPQAGAAAEAPAPAAPARSEAKPDTAAMDSPTKAKKGGKAKSEVPATAAESSASSDGPLFDLIAGTSGSSAPRVDIGRAAPEPDDRFRAITTEKELQTVLEGIERRREFGFDLETTSLKPLEAQIVGVAVSYDPSFGCYIPIRHNDLMARQLSPELVMSKLKPLLEDPRYKKIGQNLKYDWSVLRAQGLNPDGIGADTMVAGYVLTPEGRHSLETLSRQYLNHEVVTYEQVCGKGKTQISFADVPVAQAARYSAEDAWAAYNLWDCLKPKLESEGLMRIFAEVDLPLVQVLSRMELEGVHIDVPWLQHLSVKFQGELEAIEKAVRKHAPDLNLNSPRQLAKLLFEDLKLPTQTKTKTGFSTDASVLEALAGLHEVPKLLLEFREISKLKGTYVDPLPELRSPRDGKIHTSFSQTVAATGRLSSSDPNLQNIPIRSERGQGIRRAFIPSPGNVLLAADYSQIELRLLAHMSGDVDLVRSFKAEEDVHRRTASEIFKIPTDQVDDRQRGIAKAINFGLMYGKSAHGLSQELGIGRKEAADIIARYFERYSGVKRFLDDQIIQAKEKGFTTTMLGRKRGLPDIRSANQAMRGMAERMAMNTPIQGTAADLMKLAMIDIDERLRAGGYACKLIIQVHDEVVLDCPEAEADAVERLITDAMEKAVTLDVPLRVNAARGKNWMEL